MKMGVSTPSNRSPWFLVTPPQPSYGIVPRPRLDARIDDAVDRHRVTLLTAPSGYGKTKALTQWFRHRGGPRAWLTLTSYHDVDTEILAGMITALRRAARIGDAAALRPFLGFVGDSTDPVTCADRLVRTLEDLSEPVVLVVDDAHLAGPHVARGVLSSLAERAAGNLRLVLAGTHDLTTWFNRDLVAGRATVLSRDDLAFTVGDIEQAAAALGGSCPAGIAATMHERTSGWPVAVRSALLLAARGDVPDDSIDTDPLLTDYVAESVLGRLRPQLREFVLDATTCTQLDQELAEALAGHTDSGSLLEECYGLGLFLDRYVEADNATVYRWHSLFARQCRIILRRRDSRRADHLHRVAARHLADLSPAESVTHALRGHDPELAVRTIRQHWVRLVVDSNARTLERLCLELPPRWSESPDILLIRACCLDVVGDRAGAALLYERATAARTGTDGSDEHARLRALAELFLAHDQTDLGNAVDRVAASVAEADTSGSHAYELFLLGWTELRLRRRPVRAVQLLRSAHREARAAGRTVLAGRAAANLEFALAYGGHFTEAVATAEREANEQDDEWRTYDGGIDLVGRGFIAYWRDALPDALKYFADAAESGGGDTSYSSLARVFFALTTAALGDIREIARARELLDGVPASEEHGVPWPIYTRLAHALLAERSVGSARALDLADPLRHTTNVPIVTALTAELYRRGRQPNRAVEVLRNLPGVQPRAFVEASRLVTAALVQRERGDFAGAHRLLEKSLDVAAPENIRRPFDGRDPTLHRLLTEHATWGTAHGDFVTARLVRADETLAAAGVPAARLSAREREILAYLRTPMTAEEIAAALFVSVNTVRTHQRSIYRKLGVNSRRDAIKIRM
ncbi:hypothetical protein HFP48_00965 [Rhodococcus sp. DMU1]|nr:hypothetical protein HFP48_00965 [Rhodococcus sp. DMU1]